jgi:hypothetical protein
MKYIIKSWKAWCGPSSLNQLAVNMRISDKLFQNYFISTSFSTLFSLIASWNNRIKAPLWFSIDLWKSKTPGYKIKFNLRAEHGKKKKKSVVKQNPSSVNNRHLNKTRGARHHNYKPSYLGGEDQDCSSRPPLCLYLFNGKMLARPISINRSSLLTQVLAMWQA